MLNLVWDKILPNLKGEPLSDDPEAQAKLQSKLKSLSIKRPKGTATSPLASKVLGKSFVFPANDRKLEAIKFEVGGSPNELNIVTRTNGQEQTVSVSAEGWKQGRFMVPRSGNFLAPQGSKLMAATGAWTSDDTYTTRVVLYETPFIATTTYKFSGDDVTVESKLNVGWPEPKVTGKLESK